MTAENKGIEFEERKNTSPQQTQPHVEMRFEDLYDCITNFYNDQGYEANQHYKLGFSTVVGEDYDNIDLLCNLCDVIYNHCYKQNNLTKSESRNFKELCTGMKSIIRSIKQYDVSTKMDNTLISQLTGYLTKINRNYFNDRHR
jgi:hypothetical protein